jgi:hypothetical protein
MTTQLNESIDIIVELFDKYRDKPYMIQRIHQYICNRLPRTFDTIKNTYDTNQIHEEEKQNNQDTFIQNFLNNNTYLYHSPTTTFYYYDNMHYQPYSEDDILHHVLSTLSKNRELSCWKKSTKVQIMARIKQNSLLKSIPNSETIQEVLELLKPLFSSKTETKYFLTILGDTVLKKNMGLFHFIRPKAKPFLMELDSLCLKALNLHCTTTFKSKYYDHEYAACRFVPIIESIVDEVKLGSFMNIIDMICVASHYSIRYESADRFIEKVNTDQSLVNYSFFIKDRSPLLIVQQFIEEYIQVLPIIHNSKPPVNPEIHTINWKNMFYLWKHFLDQHRVPTIIFQQNFKQLLIDELSENYDSESDQFHKVYSTFIPAIQQFLNFWNETMDVVDKDNEDTYEIEEIVTLYKRWNPQSNLQDSVCLDLITYFFPAIEIIENKYIGGIQCSLWIKSEDIQKVIEQYISDNPDKKTTIYHLYEYYCRVQRSSSENPLITSKQYFEKYIESHIEDYLDLFFIGDS